MMHKIPGYITGYVMAVVWYKFTMSISRQEVIPELNLHLGKKRRASQRAQE